MELIGFDRLAWETSMSIAKLEIAIRGSRAAEVAELLIARPDLIHRHDKSGRSWLHLACGIRLKSGAGAAKKSIETVQALLDAGLDKDEINAMDEGEEIFEARPIWYAVARGVNLPLVKFLIGLGAVPEGALWAASYRRRKEMVAALLEAGADPDPIFFGGTPLMDVIKNKKFDMVPMLQDYGADINRQNGEGQTPLHRAIKVGFSMDEVEEILKLGADPKTKNKAGQTAIELCETLSKRRFKELCERYA